MSYLRTASTEALEPQATVTYLEPPVSPTPINHPAPPVPVEAPPAPAPAVVQSSAPVAHAQQPVQQVAPVAPAPAPMPAPVAPAQPMATPKDETVAVFLHLSSGERVWAGRFDSDALAEQHAAEIVRGLIRPEPGVWARFGNRLIRPEAVVSIEFAQRRED